MCDIYVTVACDKLDQTVRVFSRAKVLAPKPNRDWRLTTSVPSTFKGHSSSSFSSSPLHFSFSFSVFSFSPGPLQPYQLNQIRTQVLQPTFYINIQWHTTTLVYVLFGIPVCLFELTITRQLPVRTRGGAQRTRVTGDENATSKHLRQGSGIGSAGSRLAGGIGKAGAQRAALGEVTTIAVNRKVRFWFIFQECRCGGG